MLLIIILLWKSIGKLSLVRKDYSLIRDLLHEKISLNLGSVFEIYHGYLGVWTIELVVGEYVRNSVSAIDEIIDNQYLELGKIFDDLGHILDLSASLFAIDIDHFDTFDPDEVGEKIGRKQSSPGDGDDDIRFESAMHELIGKRDTSFL